ncbi:hypothetical protein [Micromonospora zhanjiangensis]
MPVPPPGPGSTSDGTAPPAGDDRPAPAVPGGELPDRATALADARTGA